MARKESQYGSLTASGGRHDRTAGPQHVEALIEAYAPLVKYIAHRLACRLPVSIGVEDLISTGVLGLLDAIHYDPQRPNMFKTYAEFRIRGLCSIMCGR